MRRAVVALVVAVPVVLLAVVAADAGAGRTASPPPPGPGGPLTVQADVTRKAGPATQPAISLRGKRLPATDDATPPSPETAAATSGRWPLCAAQAGVRQASGTANGARSPPAAA